MILKSFFRKYEKWNPVHPTYGAFWGIGVGVGCGVGWGPGFGPDVIGYVGAGCGAGFNVGVTLLGVGIGLPANYLLTFPRSALMATRSNETEVARARSLLGNRSSSVGDGWGSILDIPKSPFESFPGFKIGNSNNLLDANTMLASSSKHIVSCLQSFRRRLLPSDKGMPK
ncbi:cadmium-induced protein AS8-like [Andrographis paniculata]|uniref:cadmium-induced protein AS8-like n=1 Tax=Andrographis paniculata TaxID=175694 RepID=UPI0021E76459|nr:cadmium-induced protein AS8-like [Andrographis paniculata]